MDRWRRRRRGTGRARGGPRNRRPKHTRDVTSLTPFAVILPAAGSSSRFGGPRNKLLEDLAGAPVIARTVATFLSRSDVSHVVIPTTIEGDLRAVLPGDGRIRYCRGGQTRAHSVWNALREVGAGSD